MLPEFLKPIFWSWNFSELKKEEHKKTILRQIMEFGSLRDISWMFVNYKKKDLKEFLSTCRNGDLSKRSKNFWEIILN